MTGEVINLADFKASKDKGQFADKLFKTCSILQQECDTLKTANLQISAVNASLLAYNDILLRTIAEYKAKYETSQIEPNKT